MSPPIRKGDGTGLGAKGFSEVRKGDGTVLWTAGPDIPDDVVYQYAAEDFDSPWPDAVNDADMSVNGLTSSTFDNGNPSVSGDGTDYGQADGPQTLPQNETFGIAFTVAYSSTGGAFFGADSGNGRFWMFDDGNGAIRPYFQDDEADDIGGSTDSTFDDGSLHAIVVNKNGDAFSDINVYVDDMASSVATTQNEDEGFDHTKYGVSKSLNFYANNTGGTVERKKDMDAGIFEFKSNPYTESERNDFVSRRPET